MQNSTEVRNAALDPRDENTDCSGAHLPGISRGLPLHSAEVFQGILTRTRSMDDAKGELLAWAKDSVPWLLAASSAKQVVTIIGPGEGSFDVPFCELLSGSNKKIEFNFVEPNSYLMASLKKRVADSTTLSCSTAHYEAKRAQDYHPALASDLILFSHCLYHLPDPIAEVLRFQGLLEKNGKLVIFHTSERSFISKIKEMFDEECRGFKRHFLDAAALEASLLRGHLRFARIEVPTAFEVSRCVDLSGRIDSDLPISRDLINFLLGVEATPELRQRVAIALTSQMTESEGNFYLSHPVSVFVVTPVHSV